MKKAKPWLGSIRTPGYRRPRTWAEFSLTPKGTAEKARAARGEQEARIGSASVTADRQRRVVLLLPRDDVVQRVALERLAPRGANQATEILRRERLGRAGAGHVVDLFFLNGAVEIVDAVPERNLR